MQLRSCLIVFALATTFGCTPDPDVGVVEVPLSAAGADGSTYRLIGAELDVQGARFRERVSLEGFTSSISFDVPVGMYQLKLLDNGMPATTTFRLMKTEPDGTISGVNATLETPMPMSITVLPDSTTSIVLRFRVPGSEVITFAKGSIDVSTEIDTVTASSAFVSLGGLLTVGNSAQTELMPASITMPGDGASVELYVAIDQVHAWTPVSFISVCATGTFFSLAGNHAFAQLVGEATFTVPVDVCVEEFEMEEYLVIRSTRTAVPTTETFDDFGATPVTFTVQYMAQLPTFVWDGETLDLAELDGAYQSALFMADVEIRVGADLAYSAFLDGTGSITFEPRE